MQSRPRIDKHPRLRCAALGATAPSWKAQPQVGPTPSQPARHTAQLPRAVRPLLLSCRVGGPSPVRQYSGESVGPQCGCLSGVSVARLKFRIKNIGFCSYISRVWNGPFPIAFPCGSGRRGLIINHASRKRRGPNSQEGGSSFLRIQMRLSHIKIAAFFR